MADRPTKGKTGLWTLGPNGLLGRGKACCCTGRACIVIFGPAFLKESTEDVGQFSVYIGAVQDHDVRMTLSVTGNS